MNPMTAMFLVHPDLFNITPHVTVAAAAAGTGTGSSKGENSCVGKWYRPDGHKILGFVHTPILPPSQEMVQDDEIYLLDDGFC